MPIGLRRNGDGSITLTGIVGDLVYELNNSTTHVEVAYPGSTYNIAGSVYSDTCQAWHAGASLAAMAAPVSGVASLDALSFEEDSGDQTVDFGQYFTGLGITYTISPDDSIASINSSTGVVTYADDDALAETTFTVTGTNPAGNDTITQDVTVTAAADVTAPTISSTSPTDNATDIAITVNPTVTFDENVAFGTGLITLYDVTGAAAVETFDVEVDTGGGAGTVSISGAVLTIEPTADLDNSNEYCIQIAATAIDDASGNSFAGVTDTTTISFTTVAASGDYTINEDPDIAAAITITQTDLGGGDWKFDVTDTDTSETGWDGETLTTTTAAIESGLPVVISVPAAISDGGSGEKRVRRPLSLAEDPDVPEHAISILENGNVIGGEDGGANTRYAEYAIPSGYAGRNIDFKFDIATLTGAAPASPYLVRVQSGYDEVGLAFTDANWFQVWQTATTITYGLMFLSFESGVGLNHSIMGRGSRDRVFCNSSLSTLPVIGNVGPTYSGWASRQHIILTLHGTTSGSLTVRAARYYGGTVTNTGVVSTAGQYLMSGTNTHFGFNISPTASSTWTLYRGAVWDLTAYQAGAGTLFDPTATACQDLFWAGGILRDPALSVAEYGTPLYDLYGGDLSYINGGSFGQHYGSANSGAWTGKGADIAEAA